MWWGKSVPLSTIMPTLDGGSLGAGQRAGVEGEHGPDACADGGICAPAADVCFVGVKVVDDEQAEGDKEGHHRS